MSGFEHILTLAGPWLHDYGYPVLALAVLVEGAGIPVPGAVLMMGAALLAGRGAMSMPLVLVISWCAAVAGDNLGYSLGRIGGRRLLLRAGVSRRRLGRFDGFFRRYGLWLILFGRFFDGTRQLNGLVAGSARMPWKKFFLADLSGVSLWVAVWVIGLYYLDRRGSWLHQLLLKINPWIALPVLAALLITLFLLFRRGASQNGTSQVKKRARTLRRTAKSTPLQGQGPMCKGDNHEQTFTHTTPHHYRAAGSGGRGGGTNLLYPRTGPTGGR